jgi:hypothetical protein
LEFSTSLIKPISSFLSQGKFRVSVEGEMSTPRETKAGVTQGSVLSPTTLQVNNYPQCSCICVSVGSTVVLRSIAMHGFLVIISAQV